MNIVGSGPAGFPLADKTARKPGGDTHTEPLPWEEGVKYGQYLLDETGS